MAAPFARRLFLAYEIAGYDGARVRVVGRPIPVAHRGASRREGRERFGLEDATSVVAVFGALAGALSLNEVAVSAWGASGPSVLHICGERDYESLRPRVRRDDYVLLPQTDHFGEALAAADLAVSRAGGTVWELAAAGTPAILVPYPHATADHQWLNARHFELGGGAVVVRQDALDRVPSLVEELLADPERLGRMSESMRALARPDAAAQIADELVRLARSHVENDAK
jgi:UDP-N-acetylglucosamine--N-acetylmuramyl-(pentapeptide) pyrophosphoryl-undecaprenol N-acetylglucosamine transferase